MSKQFQTKNKVAEVGMCNFVLGPQSQFHNLKKALPQSQFRNLKKVYPKLQFHKSAIAFFM
jgi:hypothetical protein